MGLFALNHYDWLALRDRIDDEKHKTNEMRVVPVLNLVRKLVTELHLYVTKQPIDLHFIIKEQSNF